MITLKRLLPLFILTALALTACQKESIVQTTVVPEEVTPTEEVVNGLMTRSTTSNDGLELVCLTIEYPFEVVLLDSSIAEVAADGDLEALLDNAENFPIDFVYPLNVTDEEGNISTANDAEELAELFADCIPDVGWGDEFPEWFFPAWAISLEYSCYELIYPLTLLDIDSNEVVADSEDDLVEILADGNLYSFSFPIVLADENGENAIAENPEDLFDLLSDCAPDYGGGCGIGTYGCYEIVYPATVELLDGTSVVVESDDDFAEVIMSGEMAGFAYPLTLIDEDGNVITVDSDEALDQLLLDCFGGFDGEFGLFGCYTVEYPITVILFDSTTAVVESEEALEELMFTQGIMGFAYPLTLIDEDGNATTVLSDEDLGLLLEDCLTGTGGGGTGGEFEGDFICYDIEFPVQVIDFNGEVVEINNSEEWDDLFYSMSGGLGGFIYPVTLLDVDSGEATVVEDDIQLIEAIEECW